MKPQNTLRSQPPRPIRNARNTFKKNKTNPLREAGEAFNDLVGIIIVILVSLAIFNIIF